MLVMSRAESRAQLPSGKMAESSNKLELIAEMVIGLAARLVAVQVHAIQAAISDGRREPQGAAEEDSCRLIQAGEQAAVQRSSGTGRDGQRHHAVA